jgi:deoxyribonuclease IV
VIGCHVPVGRGLVAGALGYADDVGAEAIQLFVANPRAWALPAPNHAAADAFRTAAAEQGRPVYVHSPYLINLGSPTAETASRSVTALAHSLAAGARVGARGVVVHTGSAVDPGQRPAALRQVAASLLPMLEVLPADAPDVLLEPTAGQGGSLCGQIADLEPYLEALRWHPRVGVCLDTCHVFAAGHDLSAPGGVSTLLADLDRAIGLDRLRLVHANDAKDPCGSHRDRHENIGAGRIGLDAFRELLAHPAVHRLSVIIETPGRKEGHARDIGVLKGLR